MHLAFLPNTTIRTSSFTALLKTLTIQRNTPHGNCPPETGATSEAEGVDN